MEQKVMRGSVIRHHTTLVEILVCAVLLSVAVITAASYMTHSRIMISTQRNRRIALAAAEARLEELRTALFSELMPAITPQFSQTYYFDGSAEGWSVLTYEPGETMVIQGRVLPILTELKYGDLDGGVATVDYVDVTVTVCYRAPPEDNVVIVATRIGP